MKKFVTDVSTGFAIMFLVVGMGAIRFCVIVGQCFLG